MEGIRICESLTVAVVGAGVVGLSSALQLLRAGFDVTIIADTWTPHTTSDGAGALWERHDSDDRHIAWARATYEHYCALLKAGLAISAGVGFIEGEQYSHDKQDFRFQTDVLHFRRVTDAELAATRIRTKHPYVDGCVWTSVIVDSPTYLMWLLQSIVCAGGKLQNRRVGSLGELAGAFGLVVNCAGLRARELAADPGCIGVRGQVIRVVAPHVTRFAMTSTGHNSGSANFQRDT
jgi:D-amino-acid oxidase